MVLIIIMRDNIDDVDDCEDGETFLGRGIFKRDSELGNNEY